MAKNYILLPPRGCVFNSQAAVRGRLGYDFIDKSKIVTLRPRKQCFGSVTFITSGNLDPDPDGKKINRDKLAYKSTKIIRLYFFKKSLIKFNIRE